MAAAKKGLIRSSYGLQEYTPEEMKKQWRESIKFGCTMDDKIDDKIYFIIHGCTNLFAEHLVKTRCFVNTIFWVLPLCMAMAFVYRYQVSNMTENRYRDNHFIYRGKGREPQLDLQKTRTYFNNEKKNNSKSTYDRMFHIQHGYCSSIHRDDREHTQGLDVHTEEQSKKVPLLSSSMYGHRAPLEVPSRMHVRIGLVKRDFYRHCGATIPTGD